MTTEPCSGRPELAAWTLGLLPDAEADALAGHVAGCLACTALAAELRATAALVASAGPDAAPPPPDAALRRIAETRRADTRRLGVARGLAAVCAVGALAATGVAAWALSRPVDRFAATGTSLRLEAVAGADAAGTATLSARPWGTQVDVRTERLPRLPEGGLYEVWLLTADGQRVSAGTFRPASPTGGATVRLAAGTPLDRLAAVAVAPAGGDGPLLRAPVGG